MEHRVVLVAGQHLGEGRLQRGRPEPRAGLELEVEVGHEGAAAVAAQAEPGPLPHELPLADLHRAGGQVGHQRVEPGPCCSSTRLPQGSRALRVPGALSGTSPTTLTTVPSAAASTGSR